LKKAILILLSTISLSVQAQKRATQFSVAGEGASMATKQAYKAYALGFGGSAKILFPTGKNNFFSGTVGVLNFSGRSGSIGEILNIPGVGVGINVATPPLTIVPIKFGYKYFLSKKFNTEIELGYTIASVKKVSESITGNIGGPTFALGFGFLVNKKLDIGMRYEQFTSTASEKDYTSFVALRTLITLDFKN
jgi:hypothetical protein